MGITFPSLSYAAHVAIKASAAATAALTTFSLGHVREALAAALEYNTCAALKAAVGAGEEPVNYDGAQHVVIDVPRLEARLDGLGHGQSFSIVTAAVRQALESLLPEVKLHDSVSDLGDHLYEEIVDAIENSDGYSSELAMTNAYGGDFDLEFSEPLPIDLAKGGWTLAVDGTSSLEQDPDKVFHGDTIDVTAKVVFEKIGRRVLGEKSIDDAGGSIQDLGDPVDEDPFDFEPDGEEGGAHV